MASDREAQEDELLALQSIYDAQIFVSTTEGDRPGGQFVAHLDLPPSFQVRMTTNETAETNNGGNLHQVKHLPPILLNFELPSDYPSVSPPNFTLSCKWLTNKQLCELCKKLDEIWKENSGDVVLFMWTSFLKDDSIEYLRIESPLDLSTVVPKRVAARSLQRSDSKQSTDSNQQNSNIDQVAVAKGATAGGAAPSTSHNSTSTNGDITSGDLDPSDPHDPRAIQDIASQDLLLPTILEHNKLQEDYEFKTTLFTCQVCFMEKLGALCLSFLTCDHVFCKECMKGYFEVQIQDGSVKALTCPSDKCESQAHPSQVKELVSPELFARYDRLLLQSSLDTMSDVLYCPRKSCGCAVLVDREHNLGNCPSCQYAFCIFCKLTYHGVSPCKIKADEVLKLKQEWERAGEATRRFMEQRYGKKVIRQVIEESFSQAWLDEYSKKCPQCNTNIQKIDGCNKMTCTKCRAYFCWLCMAPLLRNNPYLHFNRLDSPCFNKLFYGVVVDDDDDAWEELPNELL